MSGTVMGRPPLRMDSVPQKPAATAQRADTGEVVGSTPSRTYLRNSGTID
jgi:hypothetical protein